MSALPRSAINHQRSGNVAAPLCGRRETIIYIKARDVAEIAEESRLETAVAAVREGGRCREVARLFCNSKFSKLAKGYKLNVGKIALISGRFLFA